MRCKRFIFMVVVILAILILQACSSSTQIKHSGQGMKDQKSSGKSIKLPVSQHVTFDLHRELPEEELE